MLSVRENCLEVFDSWFVLFTFYMMNKPSIVRFSYPSGNYQCNDNSLVFSTGMYTFNSKDLGPFQLLTDLPH